MSAQDVVGVDFSGSMRAGASLAVALCKLHDEDQTLEVDQVVLARELPGSGVARQDCYDALRARLESLDSPVVGVDAPMALPLPMMRRLIVSGGGWREASCAIAAFDSAASLRQWCRRQSASPEMKRVTDTFARTPMSPYNLRVVHQTWGVARWLNPWLTTDRAKLWPCEAPEATSVTLMEACPASALTRLGLRVPYKGPGVERAANRALLLDGLCSGRWGGPSLRLDVRAAVVDNAGGDLLDALICAWLAAQQLNRGWQTDELPPAHALEAWVVF